MHFSVLAIPFFFLLISVSVSAQTTPPPIANTTEILSPSYIHGIGVSRYSEFDPARSFKKARERAEIDLAASLLTSVYLEYYGTSTLPTQLESEFGISDSLRRVQIAAVDSAQVGDWAVFFLKSTTRDTDIPATVRDEALALHWATDPFEPVRVGGYWIASGTVPVNDFNPNRSWAEVKQEALKNLSLFLSTVVQANQREFNNSYRSINYTTSKHIFRDIHVLGRKKVNNSLFLMLAVKESNAVNFAD